MGKLILFTAGVMLGGLVMGFISSARALERESEVYMEGFRAGQKSKKMEDGE